MGFRGKLPRGPDTLLRSGGTQVRLRRTPTDHPLAGYRRLPEGSRRQPNEEQSFRAIEIPADISRFLPLSFC